MSANPVALFAETIARARNSEAFDASRCALATVAADGTPSVRFVLVKQANERGLFFYTNFGSRKARELDADPRAALAFHWHSIDVQVRVEGVAHRVADEVADAYFASRDRGSQIGAWASRQSEVLDDRQTLEARVAELQTRFAGAPVPRPEYWGGYLLVPSSYEFWYSRADRLHDRILYTKQSDGSWTQHRLQP